ncbi:MAG: hypothetical protein KAU90_08500 [Sulfurovaceae bacterium]|nr:hypothetical protein [Sulfurovaceae bacterium]
MQNKNNEDELNILLYFFKNIKYNIVLFITIILIFILSAFIYLKFTPPIYSAYTTIKIKGNDKTNSSILNHISILKTDSIGEHIELIKSFYMNNNALNLSNNNFKVRYFMIKNYTMNELFKEEIPIKVEDIKIFDEAIQGRKILLIPNDIGYTLQIKYSFIDKLKNMIFASNNYISISNKQFKYNEDIATKYFRCKIKKFSNFDKPIIIVLNSNNRYIYDKIIKNNLDVTQLEKDSPIIKIRYKDNIQKRAVSYIESLTKSLILENIKNKREENGKILEFIDKELQRIKRKLVESEKRLETYRVSNKVIKPSIQASTFIKELSKIDILLTENNLKKNLISNLIKLLNRDNYKFQGIAPFLIELNDKATLTLIENLENSEIKKRELLEEFTYKHPEVQALNKKISMIKHKIFSNISNLKKSIYQKSKELKKIKRLHNIKLKTLPVKERKLIDMKRDYEVSSTMYNFLLKRKAENDIIRVSTLSDYKVIDKAYVSNIPIGSNQINILITYITIGMIVAFVLLSLKEKGKIKSINDLKKELDIPIYGVLFLKKNIIDWDNYINLRTNIKLTLNKIEDSTSNILLISSSSEKEEKNITIVNLATIFQRAGDRVVVVDLDMRNPILHKVLKINNINSDISSYLEGNIKSVEDITYPTIYKNLDIIPIKNRPSNPSELILSIYLSKLFKVLKERYNYILVNSTPFDIIKDFRYIIKFSDINLFIFKEYCTKQESIWELKNIIEQDDIGKIGAIWIKK